MTALHGFLGRPSDWDGILGDEWTKPNWLDQFNAGLVGKAMELNTASTGGTLLGYSMGGRLALTMLSLSPRCWERAIIVSASPGLGSEEEKTARLLVDQGWSLRFLDEDWDEVVADWNGQPVFAHDPPDRLPRLESDFDRETLFKALAAGSVSLQPDYRNELRSLNRPILWIAGEHDVKYRALAEECAALNPLFSSAILPNAGHRAPWGNPTAFREAVDRFITITT